MTRVGARRRLVVVGADDASVRARAGLALVAEVDRARRALFCLTARVLTHARGLRIRFAPAARAGGFDTAWDNLRALPAARAG